MGVDQAKLEAANKGVIVKNPSIKQQKLPKPVETKKEEPKPVETKPVFVEHTPVKKMASFEPPKSNVVS